MSTKTPPYTFVLICEGSADATIARTLADRVILKNIEWLNKSTIDHVRHWQGVKEAEEFLPWCKIRKLAKKARIKSHGFKKGNRKRDVLVTNKALLLIKKQCESPSIVFLVRDTDNHSDGVKGIQNVARSDWPFTIVIGEANTKRECWVLAGYVPENQGEEKALKRQKKNLGFDPTKCSEQLTSRNEKAKKNAKRVLQELTNGSRDRELRCWEATDLGTLSENGRGNGLATYLQDVKSQVLVIIGGNSQPPQE